MRYFIALMLTGDEKMRVDRLRAAVAETFGSSVVPKVPPHVTIVRPFETVASPDLVADAIADVAEGFTSQMVDTTGFSSFNQTICFIDLDQRKRMMELKQLLEERLRRSIAWLPDEFDKEVHFHLTLAYQDIRVFLQKEKVPIKKITFDGFSLLQHNGLRWLEIERFPFKVGKE